MTRQINNNGTLNSYVINGDEIKPKDIFGYKVIAVVYSKKQWCAYRGLTDWGDEQVASEGDAIDFLCARSLFPTLARTIEEYLD